jgi:hypothetical protein
MATSLNIVFHESDEFLTVASGRDGRHRRVGADEPTDRIFAYVGTCLAYR